jgi:hypothetical protein
MASLFSVPGQIADGVRSMDIASVATTFSYKSVILYAVVIAIIVFIVFMLLGKSFDLSWLDFRPSRMKILSKGNIFWDKVAISGKLAVPEDAVEDLHDNRYTCLTDIVLKNTRPRMGGNINRHLFHRGSEDLLPATLPAYGLPKRMNPGVFLDPNVNDILIYVDTIQNSTTFRESVRIADIPLDIPFRLAIIVSKKLLEVYINCKLEVTKLLDGEPKEVENSWYGLSGSAAAEAQIQNLTIWREPLMVQELASLCPAQLPTFNIAGIDAVCKTDKPAIDMEGMKTKLVSKFELGKDALKSYF